MQLSSLAAVDQLLLEDLLKRTRDAQVALGLGHEVLARQAAQEIQPAEVPLKKAGMQLS